MTGAEYRDKLVTLLAELSDAQAREDGLGELTVCLEIETTNDDRVAALYAEHLPNETVRREIELLHRMGALCA